MDFADSCLEIARESSDSWVVRTRSGRYVRVNAHTRQIVEILAGMASLPHAPTADEAAVIKAIFDDAGETARGHRYIKGKFPLMSPALANWWARRLTGLLFRRPGLVVVLMPVIGSVVLASSFYSNPTTLIGWAYALVALLTISGSFFHELGHATALALFGRRSKGIGFGFFLYVLPCFYADVSESWLLSRAQRMIVSSAGCAFQVLFGLSLYAAGMLLSEGTVGTALLEAGRLSLALALFQLIPFHKSDGHWILRDFLSETSDPRVKTLLHITTAVGLILLALIAYRVIVGWNAMLTDILFLLRTGYAPDGVYSTEAAYTALCTLVLVYSGVNALRRRTRRPATP